MEEIRKPFRVLLVEDERVIHDSLGGFMEELGYQVLHAYDGRQALELFAAQGADVVVADIKMPRMDGLELLRVLRERSEHVEIILMTAFADVDKAIQAVRHGAFDFFRKPVALEDLVASIERTQRYQELKQKKVRAEEKLALLERERGGRAAVEGLLGESEAMEQVRAQIARVASAERTTVLVQGESGTGKELVARAVHQQSARRDEPFVSVDCTALPEPLVESELFGHEAGSFTDARQRRKGLFELGSGGTLFLDEIGDMSPAGQTKILRALEERRIRRVGGREEIPVDLRLVAASNRDLVALVAEGRFRPELFYRLNVFRIELPPLRERGGDVLLLARAFLARFAQEYRKDIAGIEPEAEKLLMAYAFPGNVRELRNIIERAVILSDGSCLGAGEFGELCADRRVDGPADELTLDELEVRAILRALGQCAGNQSLAARRLGIGRNALRYRMRKHGIEGA